MIYYMVKKITLFYMYIIDEENKNYHEILGCYSCDYMIDTHHYHDGGVLT